MATRIDLNKDYVRAICEQAVASCNRRIKTEKNPGIKLLVEKDLSDLQIAINTLSDIK